MRMESDIHGLLPGDRIRFEAAREQRAYVGEQRGVFADEGEWATGGAGRLAVALVVAHEVGAAEVEVEVALRLQQHPRPRLAALAALVPAVRAVVERGDLDAG